VIRPLGEPRIHFALNCMVRACPRLPQVPFTAAALDRQLETAAREFFDQELHVVVDTERKTVRFSQILEFYTADFVGESKDPMADLIAYCNRYRSEPIPLDYRVEFIPYDWTLNSQ
jgi:hypothetical protein